MTPSSHPWVTYQRIHCRRHNFTCVTSPLSHCEMSFPTINRYLFCKVSIRIEPKQFQQRKSLSSSCILTDLEAVVGDEHGECDDGVGHGHASQHWAQVVQTVRKRDPLLDILIIAAVRGVRCVHRSLCTQLQLASCYLQMDAHNNHYTVKPHLRDHPSDQPTPLQRPPGKVNSNIKILIFTPKEKIPSDFWSRKPCVVNITLIWGRLCIINVFINHTTKLIKCMIFFTIFFYDHI